MRVALILAFVACLLITIWGHVTLPDHVAIHFGGGGQPDNWAPRATHTMISALMLTGMFLIFWLIPLLIRKVPPTLINLPNMAYWLTPERRTEAFRRMQRCTDVFGVLTFALLGFIGYLTIRAHDTTPVQLNEPAVLIGLGVYLVATIVWLIWLYSVFRIPSDAVHAIGPQ
jgi:uncharacterized membrane protein